MSRHNISRFINKTSKTGKSGTLSEIDEDEIDFYSLNADFATQNYLDALMMKHVQEETIKAKKQIIENYLIKRSNELQNTYLELSSLQENIDSIELKLKLTKMKNNVKLCIVEAVKVLVDDLFNRLEKVGNVLNDKVGYLYLKNVQRLATEEDIAKFNAFLVDSKKLLEEIQKRVPNKEFLGTETNVLREFKMLESDYLKKMNFNNELGDTVTSLMLKIISDTLSYIE